MNDKWVDISCTVSEEELRGGKLLKHLRSGETKLVWLITLPDEQPKKEKKNVKKVLRSDKRKTV